MSGFANLARDFPGGWDDMRVSWAKRILLGIVALPIAEIFVFVAVAVEIGVVEAFLIQVACSLLGLILIRSAGRVRIARLRGALKDGVVRTAEFEGADFARLFAGILLVVPGFLTDALAALLLVPAARRLLAGILRRWLERQARAATGERVIDLDPDEWRVQEPGARGQEPGAGTQAPSVGTQRITRRPDRTSDPDA